jgi:integrase
MRLHKPSGRAVVTVRLADGHRKDVYLGAWESEEAARGYKRVIAELAAGGEALSVPAVGPTSDVTIAELMLRYRDHVVRYYRRPDGTATGQAANIRDAVRPLLELYAETPAREFGPLALEAVRERMIRAGLARGTINARVGLIRAFFKWCVGRELIPVTIFQALAAVRGLAVGRTEARETDPVRPPAKAAIAATLPFLSPTVAALVRLQLLTGARPGELVRLKAADIDRTKTPWAVRLQNHKTAHRGKAREVFFGPAARELLAPFILKAGDGYVFSPAAAEDARNAARSEARATKLWPSHAARNDRKRARRRRRPPGEHYTVASYRRAVERACKKADQAEREKARKADTEATVEDLATRVFVPVWTPHQLRHAAGTHLRDEFGIEVARAVLGHSSAFTTEIYAQFDREKAAAAVEKVG